MSISDEDDDLPQLSSETFNALQEFYKEQEEREARLQLISTQIANEENIPINEDWQLSQFWYDDETINLLVDVTIKTVGTNANIALVSCPSLYRKFKQKVSSNCDVTLFEYDERFSIYGSDFVMYDYRSPLAIPRDKSSYYDIVLADPPFLSEECLTKTAVTIRFLTKGKIVLCTGAIMGDLAEKLLDLKKSSFEPKHSKNLANEFCCYTNFNMDELL